MIPADVSTTLHAITSCATFVLNELPPETKGGDTANDRARIQLNSLVALVRMLRARLERDLGALVPDARFASKSTAQIGPMHVDAHNDLTCPYCAHRVGGHGTKGCMQPVESGGKYSCVNVPEQLCGCTKAWRL